MFKKLIADKDNFKCIYLMVIAFILLSVMSIPLGVSCLLGNLIKLLCFPPALFSIWCAYKTNEEIIKKER